MTDSTSLPGVPWRFLLLVPFSECLSALLFEISSSFEARRIAVVKIISFHARSRRRTI